MGTSDPATIRAIQATRTNTTEAISVLLATTQQVADNTQAIAEELGITPKENQ